MLEEITVQDIDIHVEASDWRDAIRKSSSYLLQSEKIKQSYVDAMIEAVERIGPYIVLGNHVALAHARPECGANALAIHFTTLEPAIPFGSERFDPIRLIITLAAVDANSHLELISELAEILMEESNVDKLADCTSEEAFLEVLLKLKDE